MDPSSGYTVTDIDNHETTNFITLWQDNLESQLQPFDFNLPEETLFWHQTPSTSGLAGSMMAGPAHRTQPPVIDLTESTPEPYQSPSSLYQGRPYTDSASYSPSETSHLFYQGETPSTMAEGSPGPQQSTACLADTNRHLLSRTPCPRRLYKCEWRDCHTPGQFHRELDLVRHIRTVHISPDKYRCDSCGKAFGRKDHLNGHRKKRHESVRHSAKAESMYSSGS
ncbi:hypothetical protein ASPVEDRAFT_82824 [Aspergillus versicolor CBS 583.65]|uniref:C2H2-type domain-containing protein n=1 Tax=Aspergillus versicolor CBS 583.65 TaxID=1036611 RepID=A0A1L9PIE3_ASPVE|nr:uncharacterized protein ASPVEDRAFT_82824 [Aspergillus versicolor CBS 583.65]OJJ01299.1 hypothetical protein ASPVEDRAFT_82824 [Aspergillus versicolor CBS 583.65]